jgi:oligo-1,6-glucosidase
MEHYFYGPKLHAYLRELKKEAFAPYRAFSVGETPGAGMEMCKLLTADYRGELDMVFNFDHLETPGHDRFDDYRYDLGYLGQYFTDWMENYGQHSWMSLFLENHDNPRMISKVDPDPKYRNVLAKLLAVPLLTLRGTPFIYQGQELGMINRDFRSIGELRDVESLNLYGEYQKTMTADDAFKKVLAAPATTRAYRCSGRTARTEAFRSRLRGSTGAKTLKSATLRRRSGTRTPS